MNSSLFIVPRCFFPFFHSFHLYRATICVCHQPRNIASSSSALVTPAAAPWPKPSPVTTLQMFSMPPARGFTLSAALRNSRSRLSSPMAMLSTASPPSPSPAKLSMTPTSSSTWPAPRGIAFSDPSPMSKTGMLKIPMAKTPALIREFWKRSSPGSCRSLTGCDPIRRKPPSSFTGDLVRREKTSVSQEDYLKAIWEMLEEQQVPISARLAEELDVTPPAVTAAVKRMARDGHVTVKRGGHILLTSKGRKFAQRLMLRHQLAEMLLTEVIGLSWAKAHAEAERMEHAISPEVEALLLKRFADRKTCPHGVPITGSVAQLRERGGVLLSDLRPNESAEILCVYEKDEGFLEFLENLRLRPSAKIEVLKRGYDETLTVRAAGHTVHLGKPATSRIWVRRVTD